jgi:hypothetical protein
MQTTINSDLTERIGRTVVKLEVVPIANDVDVELEFREVNSSWRQGVWIGTEGELEVNRLRSDQLTLWSDTAPRLLTLRCISTFDGLLRVYNVWDSGRGYGRESLRATSGMLKQVDEDGWRVYRCLDIEANPSIADFDRIVFALRVRHV